MIYVYAVGEGRGTVAMRGIEDRPVETFRDGRLTAFVSRGAPAAIAPAPAALRRHDAVVRALMEVGAVLPMRFGTLAPDRRVLREALAGRESELVAALDRVRGRVEVGVRAVWSPGAAEPAAASGREFMLAKLGRREAARQVADGVHRPLAELAADATCTLLPRADTALTAAYLVEREHAEEFERRAEELGSSQADVELVCTGPWPPYGFCEVRGG